MPFDLAHFWARFFEPFNTESRFYWPFTIGAGVALVANVIWYAWRESRDTAPAERGVRPWAFWINVIVLILVAVLLIAKQAFWVFALLFAIDAGALVYLYAFYLPPHEAAWLRERRRQRYFPQPKRRRRR